MEKFRAALQNSPPPNPPPEDHADMEIGFNFRPVQDLGGRTVYSAYAPSYAGDYTSSKWGYKGYETGPAHWAEPDVGHENCGLTSQSPINIDTSNVEPAEHYAFSFTDYDAYLDDTTTVINNGHTIQINAGSSVLPKVSWGGLPSTYKFLQVHFHWGETLNTGSEHTINDGAYPVEMHLVHWDSANYDIPPLAITEPQGAAVLGVWIEVGKENPAFNPILDAISEPNVRFKTPYQGGFLLPAESIKLEDLLPEDTSRFYRYNGSLTTPNCYESVLWTVFAQPIQMSVDQIAKFRLASKNDPPPDPIPENYVSPEDHLIGLNYRPVQDIGDRTVYEVTTVTPPGEYTGSKWAYKGDKGPDNWSNAEVGHELCGGNSQSPIDMDTNNMEQIPSQMWTFTDYDVYLDDTTNMINNGHTVQVNPGSSVLPKVSGGDLPSTYEFLQLHFHWGETDDTGSEHTEDGAHYPVEMHLVHWDSENYAIPPFAVVEPQGLAVLGVWFEVGEANPAFDPILDAISQQNVLYKTPFQKEFVLPAESIKLEDLLPEDTSIFYRYNGSLTTPNCYESVVWTLFAEPVQLSAEQIAKFRQATENEYPPNPLPHNYTVPELHPIGHNYRPVQDIGERTVYEVTASLHYGEYTASKWSYKGEKGPENWFDKEVGHELCGGNSQSPIDIDTSNVEQIAAQMWTFTNYDMYLDDTTNMINNGHTVQLNPGSSVLPKVSGGGLPSTYEFLQVHFHWGETDDTGSEHTIDGTQYPVEMHLVHWDSANYAIPPFAVTEPQGLAVLGVWFEVGEANPAFDPILDAISQPNVMYKTPFQNEFVLPANSIKLEDLLPEDTSRFYRYNGSLTTPNCYESVVWTVFAEPVQLSSEQIAKFRQAAENDPPPNPLPDNYIAQDLHPIGLNYRPVQDIGNRTVYEVTASLHYGEYTASKWSYKGEKGPENWSDEAVGNELCGGNSQSPIDIDTNNVEQIAAQMWTFTNYDMYLDDTTNMINNGHTVQLNPGSSVLPKVSGGGLPSTYEFLQVHFHWGETDDTGSEHTIDGTQYPVEMHLVHFDSANYAIPPFAVTEPQGLAVLGVWFEVGEVNPAFDPILDAISQPNVMYKTPFQNEFVLPANSIKLEDLLPEDTSRFYRYNGSLTTPNCYESVVWTVFAKPVQLSSEQIAKFRQAAENDPPPNPLPDNYIAQDLHPIGLNYRPVQDIGNRTVYEVTASLHYGEYTASKWSYKGEKGPENWSDEAVGNELCGGNSQSPIDIDTNNVEQIAAQMWTFTNYDMYLDDTTNMINNGHTVQLNPGSSVLPKVSGGGLPSTYEFLQVHFHWGETDDTGSEHTIDGTQYPVEMHLVHFDSANYAIPPFAVTEPQGLAVLGVWFEVGEANPAFDPILDAISQPNVMYKTPFQKEFVLPAESIKLEDLLPEDTSRFYRYNGSLTTPNCYESVVWTVFAEPIPLSADQIAKFRQAAENDPPPNPLPDNYIAQELHPIGLNYRSVQDIGNRTVYEVTASIKYGEYIKSKWSYKGETGAENWLDAEIGHEFCGGESQSPINIDTDSVVEDNVPVWKFNNYDVFLDNTTNIINNGHTIQVNPGNGIKANISGGGLPSTYEFLQVHFHWGESNNEGSEHTRNGAAYPVEMHLVHWDAANYFIPPLAVEAPQGLAVLGVWIEVGEENPAFNPIADAIAEPNVRFKTPYRGEFILPADSIKLGDLLPNDTTRFYRYNGSLTTPNCYESVVWTVFEDPIQMSAEQIVKFRTAAENYPLPSFPIPANYNSSELHPIGLNYRPVQAIGGRTVYLAETMGSAAISHSLNILFVALISIVHFIVFYS